MSKYRITKNFGLNASEYDDGNFFHYFPVGTLVERTDCDPYDSEKFGTCYEYANVETIEDIEGWKHAPEALGQVIPDEYLEAVQMPKFRVLQDATNFYHFFPVGTVVELVPDGDVTEAGIGTCREYTNGFLEQWLPDSFVEEIKE